MRNIKGWPAAALLVMSLLLPVGCGKNVHYTDSDKVVVDALETQRDGDALVLHITFKNKDETSVTHAVYHVEWLDKSGDKLLDSTPWRPLTVKGGHKVRVTERSTAPGVQDYQLVLSNDKD